jgi:glutaredoxin
MEAEWLKEKGVTFEEVAVDLDQAAAEDMARKSGQLGVPVTEIIKDGSASEFVLGFDKSKLASILGVSP